MPTTRRSFSQLPGRVADGSLEFMAGQVSKPIYKAAGISPGQNASSYTEYNADCIWDDDAVHAIEWADLEEKWGKKTVSQLIAKHAEVLDAAEKAQQALDDASFAFERKVAVAKLEKAKFRRHFIERKLEAKGAPVPAGREPPAAAPADERPPAGMPTGQPRFARAVPDPAHRAAPMMPPGSDAQGALNAQQKQQTWRSLQLSAALSPTEQPGRSASCASLAGAAGGAAGGAREARAPSIFSNERPAPSYPATGYGRAGLAPAGTIGSSSLLAAGAAGYGGAGSPTRRPPAMHSSPTAEEAMAAAVARSGSRPSTATLLTSPREQLPSRRAPPLPQIAPSDGTNVMNEPYFPPSQQ